MGGLLFGPAVWARKLAMNNKQAAADNRTPCPLVVRPETTFANSKAKKQYANDDRKYRL